LSINHAIKIAKTDVFWYNKFMRKKKVENNLAFIDGQNLYMGTKSSRPAWIVNLVKFRRYLKEKLNNKKRKSLLRQQAVWIPFRLNILSI